MGLATLSEVEVGKWCKRWPDANVGLVTGCDSGVVALDIDPDHGGEESLARLECAYGTLPETVEALSGGGGRHILFEHPGVFIGCDAGQRLGLGVDVRGDGGYIVVEPSRHISGGVYAWDVEHHPDDMDPAPLPDWLFDLLTWEKEPTPEVFDSVPCATVPRIAGKIHQGTRNSTLFKIACGVRGRGSDFEPILAELLQINGSQCIPPLGKREVCGIAQSACRYTPGKRRRE